MALKWLEMIFFKFQWLEILTGTELWRLPPWKEIHLQEDEDDDDEDDEAGSRTRLKEASGTRLVYKHRFRQTWSLWKDRCDRSCLLKHRMTRKALVPRLLLFCKKLVYPLWHRPVLWFFRPWCWSCSDHWLKKQSSQWFLFLVAMRWPFRLNAMMRPSLKRPPVEKDQFSWFEHDGTWGYTPNWQFQSGRSW